jgi:hypothetical protein
MKGIGFIDPEAYRTCWTNRGDPACEVTADRRPPHGRGLLPDLDRAVPAPIEWKQRRAAAPVEVCAAAGTAAASLAARARLKDFGFRAHSLTGLVKMSAWKSSAVRTFMGEWLTFRDTPSRVP